MDQGVMLQCPACQRPLHPASTRLYECRSCRIVAAVYAEEGNALIISSQAGISTTVPLKALLS
ncbi:MAG: hypothetical protein VKP72_11375 [bacterium]|jgi:hypothetical protein|nr:hypothetical protein [bacterium]